MPTIDELKQSLFFNMTKRLMKKEYPWILDVYPTYDFDRYDSVLFISILIDPILMAKSLDVTLRPYVMRNLDQPDWNSYSSFCIMTQEECSDPRIKDIENNISFVPTYPVEPYNSSTSISKFLEPKVDIETKDKS